MKTSLLPIYAATIILTGCGDSTESAPPRAVNENTHEIFRKNWIDRISMKPIQLEDVMHGFTVSSIKDDAYRREIVLDGPVPLQGTLFWHPYIQSERLIFKPDTVFFEEVDQRAHGDLVPIGSFFVVNDKDIDANLLPDKDGKGVEVELSAQRLVVNLKRTGRINYIFVESQEDYLYMPTQYSE